MYLKANNGVVEKYPYTLRDLRLAHPDTSLPKAPSEQLLASYGVYPVQPTAQPAYDPTKNIVEGTPVYVNSVWIQKWDQVDATPEEVSARNRAVHDETCCNEVKADGFVQIFVDMTPSGVEQYIDGAVTDMASAKQLLQKMGIMLLILAKRSLRDT